MSSCQILIILGAPRSGTNMLRDVLCELPGFATWPCDELNPLWRTGNARYPDDAIPASRLTSVAERRIQEAFRRQAAAQGCDVLVEKTCANCLRLDFVRACFPEARFVQIVRNPLDTILSTLSRRDAPISPWYLMKKARFVPLVEFPATLARAISSRLSLGRSTSARPWGPVIPAESLPSRRMTPACHAAIQWVECVARTDRMLDQLPTEQWFRVRYEDFIEGPVDGLAAITSHLHHVVDLQHVRSAVAAVRDRRIGPVNRTIDAAARAILVERAAQSLYRHGYAIDAED